MTARSCKRKMLQPHVSLLEQHSETQRKDCHRHHNMGEKHTDLLCRECKPAGNALLNNTIFNFSLKACLLGRELHFTCTNKFSNCIHRSSSWFVCDKSKLTKVSSLGALCQLNFLCWVILTKRHSSMIYMHGMCRAMECIVSKF